MSYNFHIHVRTRTCAYSYSVYVQSYSVQYKHRRAAVAIPDNVRVWYNIYIRNDVQCDFVSWDIFLLPYIFLTLIHCQKKLNFINR